MFHCWTTLSLGPRRRRSFSSTRPTFATKAVLPRQIGSSANSQANVRFNGRRFDPCAPNLRLRSTSNGLGRPRNLPSKGCLPRKSTRSSTTPGDISSIFPRPNSNGRNHCSYQVRDPLLIQPGNPRIEIAAFPRAYRRFLLSERSCVLFRYPEPPG
ncbi:hypothetical protein FA13DRAFT_165504 [Coprinellus micaceus]|uniref:Uncharacterized protein n=1 Tax=Coprinellus micaceus TaxID=71717 RepID=A0A4Y7SIV3_COPMI|nr:hypothetical protein FA13DRAFT_165504 [Coprinellus micaceus]